MTSHRRPITTDTLETTLLRAQPIADPVHQYRLTRTNHNIDVRISTSHHPPYQHHLILHHHTL